MFKGSVSKKVWASSLGEMRKAWTNGIASWSEMCEANIDWARQISLSDARQAGSDAEALAEAYWQDWDNPREFAIGDMVQSTYYLGDWRLPRDTIKEGRSGLGMVIDIDLKRRELTVLWHVGPHIPEADYLAFQKAQALYAGRVAQAGRYPHPQLRSRSRRPRPWTPPATDYQANVSMLLRGSPASSATVDGYSQMGTIVKWDGEIPIAVS